MVDDTVEFLCGPADKQFRLQVRVQRMGVAQDLFAAHARGALEEAGQQRWQGKDMHHVVAVIGHQNRVLLIQIEDLAQRIALLGQQIHVFDMLDQCRPVTLGQGGVRRVGNPAQQGQIQVQHPGHSLFIQGQAGSGQQGQGHQVDRVDGRSLIQMPGNFFPQTVGGLAQPFRPVGRRKLLLAPARLLLLEKLGKLDRLAEVDRDLTELLLFKGADHFENIENRFFFLACTAQFAQVGTALKHALVTDIHRYKDDRRT